MSREGDTLSREGDTLNFQPVLSGPPLSTMDIGGHKLAAHDSKTSPRYSNQ